MASSTIPEAVFLDTQVFEAASFNFTSTPFAALAKHLESGRLRLVVTDITVGEVRARITKAVTKELAVHDKFRKDSRVLRSSALSEVVAVFADLDAALVRKRLHEAFDEYLAQNRAEIVDTSEQHAGPVFEKYFAGAPPFGSGDKKHEFPDAFAIEALIAWTEDQDAELFVVSGDELFRDGCAACAGLHSKPDLAAVLDHVASDDKKLADFIRAQLVSQAGTIAESAKSSFEGLGFHVKDEWGDVEVEVTEIHLDDDPEILDIRGKEASAYMTFKASIDAHLSYDDSSTGTYDSEERRMLFMDHVSETVSREEDLVVQVEMTFEGTDPGAFEVTDAILIEPLRGYGFSSSRSEGYPWK